MTEPSDQAPHEPAALTPRALSVLHVLLISAAVVGAVWMLHRLASVVLVLVLAALFAYLLAPLVELVERPINMSGRRRHLPRGMAVALVYLLLAGAALAAAVLVLPSATEQVDDMIARAPTYTQSFASWESAWSRYYQRLRIPIGLRRGIDQSVLAAGQAGVESARASVLAAVGALSNLPLLILIPILAFFLLKDATSLRRAILTALPHRIQLNVHRLFEELNATLAAYIRAQLLACVLVGGLCGLGFAAIGVPYPALLGVLAGVLEFIPLVGPLLLAIIASIAGGLHAPVLVLWTVGFLAVLRVAEDYLIFPRLVRRAGHLNPLAVIVAVLAGADLGGVAGMFLAVPTLGMATVVYRHSRLWCGGPVEDPRQVSSSK